MKEQYGLLEANSDACCILYWCASCAGKLWPALIIAATPLWLLPWPPRVQQNKEAGSTPHIHQSKAERCWVTSHAGYLRVSRGLARVPHILRVWQGL
jgi:hypothetical protein